MIKRVLTISTGVFIGLVTGAGLGVGIGWLADILFEPTFGYWRLWGGILGILAGLASGLGISILGYGSRYSLEWLFINGLAIPFGFFLISRWWNWDSLAFILTISTFGALAGWLTVLLIRWILKERIPRYTFHYWLLVGYLFLFSVLVYTGPRLLRFVGRAISP